jgi:hypothetical protein
MRLSLAVIAMLGFSGLAAAQPAAPVAGAVVPLPPIGLPLPQIGLPLPAIGLPAVKTPQAPGTANRSVLHKRRPNRSRPYFVPVYSWPFLLEAPVATTSSDSPNDSQVRPAQPTVGRLQLEVAGGSEQQLYVDGYYVGTLIDFANGVEIDAGPHAVEIRAAGFETLAFSVNINPGRSLTYRGTMKAIDVKPPPDTSAASSTPAVPPTPMIGYIVPGCYIGNVPPQDAGLPPSCDLSRVITIKP